MKKYVVMILIAIVLIIGGGTFAYFHFANGGPWQGTWWGVQDAGVNWSGDHIRNLETVTFTQNDDKTITVDHKVQQGSREVPGSLTGTGRLLLAVPRSCPGPHGGCPSSFRETAF